MRVKNGVVRGGFLVAGLFASGFSLVSPRVALGMVGLLVATQVVEAVGAVVRWQRSRGRAAGFRASPSTDLRAQAHGGRVVLRGTVSYARASNEAMSLEFIQEGSEEENSGNWSHRWTERSRKLTVAPFYLETAAGRVRVEPEAGRARLADSLEGKILVPTKEERRELGGRAKGPLRKRVATLVPGESVWVVGVLRTGVDPEASAAESLEAVDYRQNSAPSALVVRGDPTLLVSSIPLADHFEGRARRHGRDALTYALFALAALVLLASFGDRVVGVTERGRVTKVTAVTDDGAVTGHHLDVATSRGPVSGEIDADDPRRMASEVDVRFGRYSHNVGAGAVLGTAEFAFLMNGWLVFGAISAMLATRGRRLPWFHSEKSLLVEGGGGKLPRGGRDSGDA